MERATRKIMGHFGGKHWNTQCLCATIQYFGIRPFFGIVQSPRVCFGDVCLLFATKESD